MPTSKTTDCTLDLSRKSSLERFMSLIKTTIVENHSPALRTSDTGGRGHDEIKIFECEKHEEDHHTDRLSPVIKDDESPSINHLDRLHTAQQFHHLIPPFYQTLQFFEEIPAEFISPPPTHLFNSSLNIDQNAGIPNSMYSLSYSPHWSWPIFSSDNRREIDRRPQHECKSKKSHIKKPLNAFMLFMREQREQVVQECALRESAAINQILGRKWHELDRNMQQKYYDMARDERLKHMQLYPEWSARDNYGVKKKRTEKEKQKDKNEECPNQKKCRARFGLEQQADWCSHCRRKKKCLRFRENKTTAFHISSWSEDEDTDNVDDCDVISVIE